ncbi:MAG: AzlD domain-containing protein [Paracoccus sp. (in: a-proteobacteria)]|uniref:AzlD domain-containing protein n=1 Tax=Paracoccus sp. TaxID=267 RepID=UPI0026E09411|nr:AzlD domain-containing protein [Paracoccus sp. (in: a-proteobacteria)]MDO5632488.1 AzlD domain-containing protein [Paracoccus sp. (in: a-proteobacteria)]
MSDLTIWAVILVTGMGTFLLRFSFLGALGRRSMPPMVLRLLRFTPVAVLPALSAPLVVWPAATDGQTDPARLTAAIVTVAVGILTRNVLAAILAGAATLALMVYWV